MSQLTLTAPAMITTDQVIDTAAPRAELARKLLLDYVLALPQQLDLIADGAGGHRRATKLDDHHQDLVVNGLVLCLFGVGEAT